MPRPLVRYYYDDRQHMLHEHTGQVDFNVSKHRVDWRIMTVVPMHLLEAVSAWLAENIFDVFDMDTHILPSNDQIALVFRPKLGLPSINQNTRRKLLGYLASNKMPIKWKEGEFGYDIGSSGRINRKWKLRAPRYSQLMLPRIPEALPLALLPPSGAHLRQVEAIKMEISEP